MAGLRVVLDTNVLVSGLAYPGSIPGRILNAWQHGAISVVLSRYILDEFVRVLPRLKRIALTHAEVRDLTDSLMLMAETVEPDAKLEKALRDKADQAVLATLRASHADYLVTGDKDLLALAVRYPIVTPAMFWQRHGG
jgi:putative PIN family toxin of toxin-antitoxin system